VDYGEMLLLCETLPIVSYKMSSTELTVITLHNDVFVVLYTLKNHVNYRYKLLSCISGVDFFHKLYRFCVVYDLLSLLFNCRIRVKIFVNEITPVNSSIKVYVNANWWEREIWDLFGIYFDKHGDLRRILTDYGFEGHPMRKDFPLSGYIEFRYNDVKKKMVSDHVQLSQEYRTFSSALSW
jgi:NADH/F420H2 dehydrogenase subunit C